MTAKTIELNSIEKYPKMSSSSAMLFDQYYDLVNFCRTMSMSPFIKFKSGDRHMNVGSSIRFICWFPFFTYSFTVVQVVPKEKIVCTMNGLLKGTMCVDFFEREQSLFVDDHISARGVNWFAHVYYQYVVSLMHGFFMRKKLRQMYENTLQME